MDKLFALEEKQGQNVDGDVGLGDGLDAPQEHGDCFLVAGESGVDVGALEEGEAVGDGGLDVFEG